MIPRRKDDRIIIHFDYDCFYASVFEADNPALRQIPLGVQQKQIIVTCNYEARRRGLHKLQLITEARKICPDVVIVLGENLDKFRNVSKMLYNFLESFTWNKKVERLGFDEVFMDVTDIINYNAALLNHNNLTSSFFQLSRDDPTCGFSFDATNVAGHQFPELPSQNLPLSIASSLDNDLRIRLMLGSHLARYLRHRLEADKGGYTSTVGISTSKLLAKLVGNLHKPKGQTVLMPPYENILVNDNEDSHDMSRFPESNVTTFIDSHDIGKIPGIGFKMSHKIRNHVLSRPATFGVGLVYGETLESVKVRDVRLYPGMSPQLLEKIVGGPGMERGIGGKVWDLINGVDDTEVKEAKKVPSSISIEDSYIRLDSMLQVQKELRMLTMALLKRMHVDLLEDDEEDTSGSKKRWHAHPKTIRLSTRPRPPLNADGSRTRSFKRISRSAPLPNFVFSLREDLDALVEKLVQATLLPLFNHLHPVKQGWNLSLVNIAVTNMEETAHEDGSGGGRDIGRMFKQQKDILREWKVEDKDIPPDHTNAGSTSTISEILDNTQAETMGAADLMDVGGTEDLMCSTQHSVEWDEDGKSDEYIDYASDLCSTCGAVMPAFAMAAHERYHTLGD